MNKTVVIPSLIELIVEASAMQQKCKVSHIDNLKRSSSYIKSNWITGKINFKNSFKPIYQIITILTCSQSKKSLIRYFAFFILYQVFEIQRILYADSISQFGYLIFIYI